MDRHKEMQLDLAEYLATSRTMHVVNVLFFSKYEISSGYRFLQ